MTGWPLRTVLDNNNIIVYDIMDMDKEVYWATRG